MFSRHRLVFVVTVKVAAPHIKLAFYENLESNDEAIRNRISALSKSIVENSVKLRR